MERTALDLFKEFEHFSKCLLDAYVVLDCNGKVLKCNQLFSSLVGMRSRQILKADSFDDILTLRIGGDRLQSGDILGHASPTRLDEVNGSAGEKSGLNLIIGVYPLIEEGISRGSFVLIRDVTAETNLQDKYKDKATQSITDALTGLYNRAYFSEYMGTQIGHLEKLPVSASHRNVSIIMIDIDHFKKTNDVFGHQAGDYVIKTVADIMKSAFRKTDVVCRYGGEEFLAILPGTELRGGTIAAEKFRRSIQNYKFEFEGTVIPTTISSGIAQVKIGVESGEQTIARADAALYHSKESGRNVVSEHDGKEIQAMVKTSTEDVGAEFRKAAEEVAA